MTEHEHLDYTPRPAESAAEEIRLRIGALDSKIATSLKEAEMDEQNARASRDAARRMAKVRDEYRALLKDEG